jgi:hypothetical protein
VLTKTLEASKTYKYKAVLPYTTGGTAAGGHKYGFSYGGTVNKFRSTCISYISASAAVAIVGTAGDASSAINTTYGHTASAGGFTILEGIIVTTTASTFAVKFAQNVSNAAASSVSTYASLEIEEI